MGIMGIEKKNWSEAEIRKMYAEADLNGDGLVSAEEALLVMTSLRARQRADWLDKNKDGEVTLDELKQAFAGSDFSDVQLLEMLLAADTNGNGKVSLDEIKSCWNQHCFEWQEQLARPTTSKNDDEKSSDTNRFVQYTFSRFVNSEKLLTCKTLVSR